MTILSDETVFAKQPTWADGYARWHVLVPIRSSHPRELARELIALELADRVKVRGESWTDALDRVLVYLDQPGNCIVNLGEDAQRLALRSGQVEYVEFALPQDEQ